MDVERLIEEVEERPGLYNKAMPEYSNKVMKESLWMDVAKNVFIEWDDISEVEREKRCKRVQLKWKYIRDNFRRDLQLEAQQSTTSGQGVKKKRKYKYFDQMLFLRKFIKDGTGCANHSSPDRKENVKYSPTSVERSSPVENTLDSDSSDTPRRKPKVTHFEEELLPNYDPYNKNDLETDEDRAFCLSLVTSLKKMSETTKLDAKIGILKVIRQHTIPQPDFSFSESK